MTKGSFDWEKKMDEIDKAHKENMRKYKESPWSVERAEEATSQIISLIRDLRRELAEQGITLNAIDARTKIVEEWARKEK